MWYPQNVIRFSVARMNQGFCFFSVPTWVKSKTDRQFIAIERQFVVEVIQYIELNKYSDGFLGRGIKEKWDLEVIKSHL